MNNMAVHAESLNLKMAGNVNMAAFVNLQDGGYRGNFEL
jgi:hypothetical protein